MGTIARLLFSYPERDYWRSDRKPRESNEHDTPAEIKLFSSTILFAAVRTFTPSYTVGGFTV
jgi:hypothetical protein